MVLPVGREGSDFPLPKNLTTLVSVLEARHAGLTVDPEPSSLSTIYTLLLSVAQYLLLRPVGLVV